MEEYLGMIKLFAGNFAPRGWMFCDGTRLESGRWSALYSLLGETYGGDGYSFNLPDLRNRVPVGVVPSQPGDYYQGGTGGNKTIKLTEGQLPAHAHPATATATATATGTSVINVSGDNANLTTPATDGTSAFANVGKGEGRSFDPSFGYTSSAPTVKLSDASSAINVNVGVTVGVTVGATGTGGDIDIRQPYMGMNYIICVEGIYPSRP